MRTILNIISIRRAFLLNALLFFCFINIGRAEESGVSVTLEWDANTEPDLAGYKVFFKTGTSGNRVLSAYNGSGLVYTPEPGGSGVTSAQVVNSGFAIKKEDFPDPNSDTVTCRLSGLNANLTYFFVVTAFDTEGLESEASNEASRDITPPSAIITYSAGDTNHINVGPLTVTSTFSETVTGTPQIVIDRPGSMSTITANMSGTGTVWTYVLNIPMHSGTNDVDGLYTVSLNANDLAGNAVSTPSNNTFITDTKDYDGDGMRDYEDDDDDNDGLPDVWEITYGLNHQNASGDDGRDGDFDHDGWMNYEEYTNSYNPSNAGSPAPEPPKIREAIPPHNSGIMNSMRVPIDTSFAVRIESEHGIDITDSSAVTFEVAYGGEKKTYFLNDKNADGMAILEPVPLTSGVPNANRLWVVYHRSAATPYGGSSLFPFDASVGVSVFATDIRADSMLIPGSFNFKVEGMTEHNAAHAALPDTTLMGGSGITTIRVDSGVLEGAKIVYGDNVPVAPYFGPTNEIPDLDYPGASGVALPMNLQPPTVFPGGVTVFIPVPGYTDVSEFNVYGHNGDAWGLLCDSNGNFQPDGEGWLKPDWNDGLCREILNNGSPSGITIWVYHFSSFVAGAGPVLSEGNRGGGGENTGGGLTGGTMPGQNLLGGGGGGSGCFISTLMKE